MRNSEALHGITVTESLHTSAVKTDQECRLTYGKCEEEMSLPDCLNAIFALKLQPGVYVPVLTQLLQKWK